MPRNPAITPALRLAAVALARATTPLAAARLAGVKTETVKAWLAAAPAEDPDADWAAVRALATERVLAALVSGKSTGASAWTTVKAVAERNLHVAQQIRDRAQRRAEQAHGDQPEPEEEWQRELRAAPDDVRRVMVTLLDAQGLYDMLAEDGEPEQRRVLSDEELSQGALEWVRALAALSPEELAERLAEAKAEQERADDAYQAHQTAKRQAASEASQTPPEPLQPPPMPPIAAPPAPPRPESPGLRVLRDDELEEMRDQEHLWHRME